MAKRTKVAEPRRSRRIFNQYQEQLATETKDFRLNDLHPDTAAHTVGFSNQRTLANIRGVNKYMNKAVQRAEKIAEFRCDRNNCRKPSMIAGICGSVCIEHLNKMWDTLLTKTVRKSLFVEVSLKNTFMEVEFRSKQNSENGRMVLTEGNKRTSSQFDQLSEVRSRLKIYMNDSLEAYRKFGDLSELFMIHIYCEMSHTEMDDMLKHVPELAETDFTTDDDDSGIWMLDVYFSMVDEQMDQLD